MFAAFEEEGEQYLVEAMGDIYGKIVDAILDGALAEGGEEVVHLEAVVVGNLVGLQLDLSMSFEVDEEVGACLILEVDLVGEVEGVEEDDLVFVVPEMAEGIEERLLFVGANKGVGEEDNKGTFVELLCGEMERLGEVGTHSLPSSGYSP